MAPIHFQLAPKPDTWDNIDQLAQIEVDDGGVKHFYYLYWHRQASMVLLEVQNRNQCYWSCGRQTLSDLFRYFQGLGLQFQVKEAWGRYGTPGPELLDQPMVDIKNQHRVVSIDCSAVL